MILFFFSRRDVYFKLWFRFITMGCYCYSVAKSCLNLCKPKDCIVPGSCPPLSPGVCSNSCPLSQWCYLTISSSVTPFSFCPQSFSAIFSPQSFRVFSNESALCIRWPKYWSFSISSSNECSGLTSFRIDWFDLLAVQGTPKNLLQHHNLKASILWC